MSGKKTKKAEGSDDKITFDVWFNQQTKEAKLGFWQKNEISVFFKEKGLSDKEDADKYSELLKLY